VIPVYEPYIGEEEVEAVAAAVRAGEISGSFGENLPAFEREFADFVGAHHGVATSSGTTALHLALQALDIGAGDEVLVSASTNIATALAVYHNGGVPVPVDSEPTTWNLDLALVESLITSSTRAIVPVHLFGHPVEMDELVGIAERRGIAIVEDCAESHGATVRGRQSGTFGRAGCFSFYANKIITTGEGGMVVTDDEAVAEQVRLLRNLAFGRPRFYHEAPGHNFRMTGYQAAMGRVQLTKIEHILAEKRRVADAYTALLAGIPGIRTPVEEPWARNVYWMYGIVVEDDFGLTRDELATQLLERGIETRTFFCPMNLQPFLRDQPGFRDIPCPVAEDLWRRGLYLPSSPSLTNDEVAHVAAQLSEVAAVRS
jgi:perosamine synthetase